MSISRKEPLFSLADQLFNANTVEQFAGRMAKAHHKFDQAAFTRQVLAEFPSLELKARINFMVDRLEEQLPGDYDQAIAILLKALPPPLDPTR